MIKLVKKAIPVVAAAGIFLNIFAVARADVLRAPGGGTVRPLRHRGEQLRARAKARRVTVRRRTRWISPPCSPRVASKRRPFSMATPPRAAGRRSHERAGEKKPRTLGTSCSSPSRAWACRPRNRLALERPLAERHQRTDRAFQFQFFRPEYGKSFVNIEMRAWLARLDAKGVDTVLVMDSCFGGGMRGVDGRALMSGGCKK